jgi:hypothetical protein
MACQNHRTEQPWLWIGRRYSGYTYPAIGTRVEGHNGSIKRDFEG